MALIVFLDMLVIACVRARVAWRLMLTHITICFGFRPAVDVIFREDLV